MVWVYKLKNLSLLSWVGLSLLALNIVVGFVMLFSEPSTENGETGLPTLELFSSDAIPGFNVLHAADHTTSVDNENTLNESLHDADVKHVDGVLSEHKKNAELMPQNVESNALILPEPRQHQIISLTPARMCYEIGPLALSEDKTKLQNRLETKGMFASIKYYQTNEELGYWVFIPPLRSKALGRLKVEELKLKGFNKTVLLNRTAPINAISLGVYESERDAHELLLKAQSLGFDVRMDVRSQGVANAWLAVEVDRQRDMDDAGWDGLLRNYTGLTRRSVECL